VNILEQLPGGVVTPSIVIEFLPGHEAYTVSLSNNGNTGKGANKRLVTITIITIIL